MTRQRRRVLDAVTALVHATPEDIVGRVAVDGDAPLSPSTVYRALDTLESLGVVGHTHLDHGAPSYHLAEHADHIHLVCRGCGMVAEVDADLAADFAGNVRARTGFVPEVTHMAVHGWCSTCAKER